MNTPPTDYAAAQRELTELLDAIQQPDAPIDTLTAQVARAKFLIDWARERLRTTEEQIDTLLSEGA